MGFAAGAGMISVSAETVALKRARTTFQRLSDAKFFTGWVRRISPNAIVVFTHAATPVQPGDEFSFHVFGNSRDAFFQASLTGLPEAPAPALPGDPGRSGQEYVCTINTPIRFKQSSEQPRFSVDDVNADIVGQDSIRTQSATVLDVGPTGFAAVTGKHLSKGELVQVALYTAGLCVGFVAEVRNCVSYGSDCEFQRTGFKIVKVDRVNSVRWKQLYMGILEDNRVGWDSDSAEIGSVVKLKPRAA